MKQTAVMRTLDVISPLNSRCRWAVSSAYKPRADRTDYARLGRLSSLQRQQHFSRNKAAIINPITLDGRPGAVAVGRGLIPSRNRLYTTLALFVPPLILLVVGLRCSWVVAACVCKDVTSGAITDESLNFRIFFVLFAETLLWIINEPQKHLTSQNRNKIYYGHSQRAN